MVGHGLVLSHLTKGDYRGASQFCFRLIEYR